MSLRKVLFVLLALASAGVTLLVARQMLQVPEPVQVSAPAPAPAPVEPELRVLVAARGLPAGTLIKAEDLKWQVWPEDDPALPSLLREGAAKPLDYRGAVVRRGVDAGEPIVAGRLVKPGEQGFLAAVLDPGRRAVSVPINGVTGLAGLVFPGDRVDLILTHTVLRAQDPNLTERRLSETVLTDLRVLAIDQMVDDQTTAPRIGKIATLEVRPKEAELVVLMAELGQLSLSLRALSGEAAAEVEAPADLEPAAERLARLLAAGDPESPPVAGDPEGPQLHGRVGAALAALGASQPDSPSAAEREELAALGLPPLHPAERRARAAGTARPYSWDSDVSAVLPGPMDPKDSRHTVRVMRGAESADKVFNRVR